MKNEWLLPIEEFTERLPCNSFYDNLCRKLTASEVFSLNVLGEEFFEMVDQITRDLFVRHGGDCLLLEMTQEEFWWELQVFSNLFLRECCQSAIHLKGFCKELKIKFEIHEFREEFAELLDQTYQNHFYLESEPPAYLV